MRAILILCASLLAAAAISLTACESLYDDYMPSDHGDYIYLFRTKNPTDGNLGGRSGADTLCQYTYETQYPHLGAQNVRAFLNVSPYDTISQMPENYGVPTDVPVMAVSYNTGFPSAMLGSVWDDLLDRSINITLGSSGADVFQLGGDAYWTGDINGNGVTDFDGSSHCNGWTDNSASLTGVRGNSANADRAWLNWDNRFCNDNLNNRLLCVAW